MTKNDKPEQAQDTPAQQKSKRRGWLLILGVAVAIALFLVLGTMDQDLRYDLIGL